jgi:hypothetical protein
VGREGSDPFADLAAELRVVVAWIENHRPTEGRPKMLKTLLAAAIVVAAPLASAQA